MNNLTSDYIAVDTNVFEHLMNPQNNTSNHIYKLLTQFINDKILLLVDNKNKIKHEYLQNFQEYLKHKSDRMGEGILLFHFFKMENHEVIDVNLSDNLMNAIKKIVPEHKGVDRFFVYVAFKKSRVLVTNDKEDIIDEGPKCGERRRKLLKHTKRYRPRSEGTAAILTSQEAYDRLQ